MSSGCSGVGKGKGNEICYSPFIHQTLLGDLFVISQSLQQKYEVHIIFLILLMKKWKLKEAKKLV